jgi:hypothetical protein
MMDTVDRVLSKGLERGEPGKNHNMSAMSNDGGPFDQDD